MGVFPRSGAAQPRVEQGDLFRFYVGLTIQIQVVGYNRGPRIETIIAHALKGSKRIKGHFVCIQVPDLCHSKPALKCRHLLRLYAQAEQPQVFFKLFSFQLYQ